ncbi:MAG: hypothetical protein ACK5L6_07530 [Anaerorhabdus sp.]|uniref:phage head-tail connector protein n=1 Tax=Anaerorhabdus sp. TaxID=1872524 RepID=UPI003A85AA19
MLSDEFILKKIKPILEYDDTGAFDEKLKVLIQGAIGKLENEGVKNIYSEESNEIYKAADYTICIAYQVAMDGQLDIDYDKLNRMYTSRVISLRCSQPSI